MRDSDDLHSPSPSEAVGPSPPGESHRVSSADIDDPASPDPSSDASRDPGSPETLSVDLDPSDERARLLARLIAAGVPLADAARTLRLPTSSVISLTASPEWPSLVREEVKNVDILYDEDSVRRMLDPLIPAAIELKKDILRDESAALKLRNEVATEILKIAGLHRTKKQEVHVFVHPAQQTVHATVAELVSASDDEDD